LDKRKAIISAYSEVFAPCMAGAITDGLGCLTISFASIPLMQKLAFISSFWVISILVAVTLLNPIILYFLPTPNIQDKVKVHSWLGKRKVSTWSMIYQRTMEFLMKLSGPRMKWAVLVVVVLLALPGAYTATHLKIGDSSAGGAILYPDHPYNVAAAKMNEKFVGGSRLVVVVKGKEKGAIKDQNTLQVMDKLGSYMQNNIPNVGGTMSLTDLVRRINRLYHDGSPKWEIIPNNKQHLGGIYFMLASNMAPGEMDQFVSLPDYTHSNVTAFFRNYNHATIKSAISETKEFADEVNSDSHSKVEIKLAGGILGILAAVNEEVEWSYWAIFIIIFSTVFVICLVTYRSIKAALILIIPVFVAQVLCDLFMMLNHIDLNIDSLPVASVGVGVGIDYGIYLMSRLREECGKTDDFEKAKLIALTTTGKTIMFTALTIAVALIPWLFSSLKFQAEMGVLILFLMIFNMIGALVFVPALSAVLRPKFIKNMGITNKRQPIDEALSGA
jgi:predicted RND superfamily exporter protein